LERDHRKLVQAVAAPVEAKRRVSEIGMCGVEIVVMQGIIVTVGGTLFVTVVV
jgi:hypothetical protein